MTNQWRWLLKLAVLALIAAAGCKTWALLPITILNTQTLVFGTFSGGAGGTVTVGPTGTRTSGGGVVLLSSGGSAAAQFLVAGDANATYAITLPTNDTVSISNGAQSIPVNSFTSSPQPTGQLSPLVGNQTLFVGATLNVAANQARGAYTGTFQVLVIYN